MGEAAAAAAEAKLDEVAAFFEFSLLPSTTYRGTVQFNVTVEGIKKPLVIAVRIEGGPGAAAVHSWRTPPPDGKTTCIVDCSLPDFIKVYEGAGTAEIAKLCLSGRIYVRWFKFRDLQAFAASFDYASVNWLRFYKAQGLKDQFEAFLEYTQEHKPRDTDGNVVEDVTLPAWDDDASGDEGTGGDSLDTTDDVAATESVPPVAAAASQLAPAWVCVSLFRPDPYASTADMLCLTRFNNPYHPLHPLRQLLDAYPLLASVLQQQIDAWFPAQQALPLALWAVVPSDPLAGSTMRLEGECADAVALLAPPPATDTVPSSPPPRGDTAAPPVAAGASAPPGASGAAADAGTADSTASADHDGAAPASAGAHPGTSNEDTAAAAAAVGSVLKLPSVGRITLPIHLPPAAQSASPLVSGVPHIAPFLVPPDGDDSPSMPTDANAAPARRTGAPPPLSPTVVPPSLPVAASNEVVTPILADTDNVPAPVPPHASDAAMSDGPVAPSSPPPPPPASTPAVDEGGKSDNTAGGADDLPPLPGTQAVLLAEAELGCSMLVWWWLWGFSDPAPGAVAECTGAAHRVVEEGTAPAVYGCDVANPTIPVLRNTLDVLPAEPKVTLAYFARRSLRSVARSLERIGAEERFGLGLFGPRDPPPSAASRAPTSVAVVPEAMEPLMTAGGDGGATPSDAATAPPVEPPPDVAAKLPSVEDEPADDDSALAAPVGLGDSVGGGASVRPSDAAVADGGDGNDAGEPSNSVSAREAAAGGAGATQPGPWWSRFRLRTHSHVPFPRPFTMPNSMQRATKTTELRDEAKKIGKLLLSPPQSTPGADVTAAPPTSPSPPSSS